MFVHDFVHLDCRPEDVQQAVLADHGSWMEPLFLGPDYSHRLMRVGPKAVEVELGEPMRRGATVVVPIRWIATGASKLFPTLDADLEVSPLDDAHTRLALSGRYNPPLGAVGRTLDDLWLHGLAEDTLRSFLRRLGDALNQRSAPQEVTR